MSFLQGTVFFPSWWRKAYLAKTRLAATPGYRRRFRNCGPSTPTRRELGLNAHSFARIDGYCSERKVWSFNLAPFEGVIARRAVVDQFLRDRVSAAGCQIWYGAHATDLRVSGRQIELTIRRGADTHTLAPSAVILATGGGCRIARQAGLDGDPGLGASLSSYIPTDGNFASPTFLFGEPSPGYSWVFPMGANASNAGVFALSKPQHRRFGPR